MAPPAASTESFDVIVVGGGFAGLRAARDLLDAGRDVLVLEARERLGGRTLMVPFPGSDKHVELGAAWVAPRYHRWVAQEMDRYGLALAEPVDMGASFNWRFDGEVSSAFPLAGDQLFELERAIYRIIEASHRIDTDVPRDEGDLTALDVSVEEFLRGLDLSERTYDFLAGFGSLGSGAESSEWSAITALSLIAAFDCSAYAWLAAVTDKFAGGTATVVDALVGDAQPDVRLSTAVERVEQRPGEVVVSAAGGQTFAASAVIMAVPLNVWRDIEFVPELSEAKATLRSEGHPNRMGKLWALVEGAPPDTTAFGPDSDLLLLAPQYEVDGALLMVGFSAPPSTLDVTDGAAVERAVRQHFPHASVRASLAHDWNADPFSNGGWQTYRPGHATRYMSGLQTPEGRVYFAGADTATKWIGWLDGALETGARAAGQALMTDA